MMELVAEEVMEKEVSEQPQEHAETEKSGETSPVHKLMDELIEVEKEYRRIKKTFVDLAIENMGRSGVVKKLKQSILITEGKIVKERRMKAQADKQRQRLSGQEEEEGEGEENEGERQSGLISATHSETSDHGNYRNNQSATDESDAHEELEDTVRSKRKGPGIRAPQSDRDFIGFTNCTFYVSFGPGSDPLPEEVNGEKDEDTQPIETYQTESVKAEEATENPAPEPVPKPPTTEGESKEDVSSQVDASSRVKGMKRGRARDAVAEGEEETKRVRPDTKKKRRRM